MPVPLSTPPVDLSLLEQRLAAAIERAGAQASPLLARFWADWQAAEGEVIASLADFRAACDQPEGALLLMDRTFGILQDPAWQAPLRQAPDALRSLVQALVLAAAERHVREQAQVGLSHGEGQLTVHVENSLVAEMLAAVHLDCGLMMVRHPQTDALVAANVLRDTPALEYGSADAERAAWDAELLAYADAGGSPQAWLSRAKGGTARTLTGAQNPLVVKLALRRLHKAWQVRPLIAIAAGSRSSLVHGPALRQALAADYGVGSFVHSPLAASAPAAVGAQQLQNTVLRYVNAVFDAFDATQRSAALPAPQRHSVFISYAHADGDLWRQRIALHLAGLGDGLTVLPWDDRQINTGDDWYQRIEGALSQARCAVLVVSPGFLASRFIESEEMPRLWAREQSQGLAVLPVLATDCVWITKPWVARLQALANATPLDQMASADQNTALKNLALQIHGLLPSAT